MIIQDSRTKERTSGDNTTIFLLEVFDEVIIPTILSAGSNDTESLTNAATNESGSLSSSSNDCSVIEELKNSIDTDGIG